LSMAITDLGREAISFTGSQAGIVTDAAHGRALIVDIRSRRVLEALEEGKIVIVAGFQGVSTELEVTTLGRGGSDTTAVALAAALAADCVIYTDVAGVFTADPRLVPGARKLVALSYEEMLEMASSGARVMMARSEEIVFSAPPEDRGVVERTLAALEVPWSARDGLGKVSLVGAGMKSHPGVAAKAFAILESAGIEPAVVSTSPIKIACHIATADVDRAVQALHEAFDLGE